MDEFSSDNNRTVETIRVLIVDSNAETREKTRSLLGQEKDIEILGAARTGREAIDLAQETQPDVVVLDVNTQDMDEIGITEAICRRVPFAQIVILAVQVDPAYMRRAMQAGARDFIVKPPMADELRSAVYRAGGLAQERRISSMRILPRSENSSEPTRPQGGFRGKIIQVYSPKGGTGTTTLAVNLAISLHSANTKAIVVDGNLQYGDVAIYMNEVGYHSILDLTQRIDDLDPEVITSVINHHEGSGVDLMAAPTRPEEGDKVTGEEFYKVLQYLRRLYTYVIVDTPPSLSEITISALDSTDLIILVTTQEIPSIKNSRLFLSVLDGLHVNRLRLIHVLNKYDRMVALSPEKIGENLKQEVALLIPNESRTALRSENQGNPFIVGAREEPIAKAVMELANVVRTRLDELANADNIQVKSQKQTAPG